MKKLLITSTIAAGIAIAGIASAAMAPAPMMTGATTPWYVGVGLNYSSTMTSKITWTAPNNAYQDVLKLDKRNLGGNLFVGYRVNRYFGTELGFTKLGDTSYQNSHFSGAVIEKNAVKLSSQWNLHLVGQAFLPMTSWFSPYAFAGIAYINSKYKTTTNPTPGTTNQDGFGLVYGAGLEFNFNQFGVRASYTRQDLNTSNHNAAGLQVPQPESYLSLDELYRFGA